MPSRSQCQNPCQASLRGERSMPEGWPLPDTPADAAVAGLAIIGTVALAATQGPQLITGWLELVR